jgi:hydroxysqualene synthase
MSAQVKGFAGEFTSSRSNDIGDAYAWCERLARSHYENFPVGSLLIPRAKRKHVYAVYAFARIADDFADEEHSLNALNDWERQLIECYQGKATHPAFLALATTARELLLPVELFQELLSAFKQDVVKGRYRDFDELLDYCRRSANPVGRLILRIFGYDDSRLDSLSDCICTALQLANFWQDVSVDLDKDRIYIPQGDLAEFGIGEADLRERRFSAAFAALLKLEIDRTRDLFRRGIELPELVRGRLRYELRLTWHGGMRILERIEEIGYDTLNQRPVITARDKFAIATRALREGGVPD